MHYTKMGIAKASEVRRLLVITYHFPPDGAIGGQRWAALSKYLARLGWEVHVVTASPADRKERTNPGVHRHFRPRRQTLGDLYQVVVHRISKGARWRQRALNSADRPGTPTRSQYVSAGRRLIRSLMYLPDPGRGWVGRATGAARALLRERRFDLVVASGPPHSTYFAGLAATIGGDVPYWIDMRDPWSLIHEINAPADWLVRSERFVLRCLERIVFPAAARIIVNTREFASALTVAQPELMVSCVPNGIDLEEVPARDVSGVEKDTIACVGTLYAGRNLSSMLAAMSAVLRDRPDAAASLRLNVAGSLGLDHRERMLEQIEAGGLEAVVKVHGLLPRAKALELLTRSHLALVLAQNQPLCVPAKLYESVGLGIPTLVIAERDSAAASEATRIGAMTIDGSDVEAMRKLLEDLVAGRIPYSIPARAPVSYEYLAGHVDALLRDALSGSRADPVHKPFARDLAQSMKLAAGRRS